MSYPQVAILILNWNGKKWLETFLPSVVSTTYPNKQIWVIDNGSTDDSLAFLTAHYPEVIQLPLDKNYGFTVGNNKALPHIQTPYYVLLNSDVEVSPGWLEPLVGLMESDPQIAAIQPKLLAYHDRGSFEYAGAAGGCVDSLAYPFCRGRLFDTLEQDKGQYNQVSEIFWASGACCLIRKSVTDQIGLFEPTFFAHMEEIDFCWRAKNFGYKIMYQPRSVVWHVGGGTLPKTNPRKLFLNIHNSLAMMLRNLPASQLFPKIFLRLCLDGVFSVHSFIFKGDIQVPLAVLKAHFAFYGKLVYWIKTRRQIYREISPKPQSEGVYSGSVVWAYFGRGKKKLADL